MLRIRIKTNYANFPIIFPPRSLLGVTARIARKHELRRWYYDVVGYMPVEWRSGRGVIISDAILHFRRKKQLAEEAAREAAYVNATDL